MGIAKKLINGPREFYLRLAAISLANFNIKPTDPIAETCSQGFYDSFFCGKAGSKGRGWIAMLQAIVLLGFGKDFIKKMGAVARNASPDTAYFNDIATYSCHMRGVD